MRRALVIRRGSCTSDGGLGDELITMGAAQLVDSGAHRGAVVISEYPGH